MQVGQLKEIIALIQKIDKKQGDYGVFLNEEILDLQQEDVSIILKNKKNENIPILINFLTYWAHEKNRETFYENLNLKKDDAHYKNIIIEKILEAKDIGIAHSIFCHFDDDLPFNEEEWLMYLKCLPAGFSDKDVSSLEIIIENIDKCKLQAIKKVMLCLKNDNLCVDEYLVGELERLTSDDEILTFFDLYSVEYEYDDLINLIEKMRNEDYGDESVKIVNYLKEPKIFDGHLPNLFLTTKKEEVDEILEFLSQVTIANVLSYYTEVDERFDNDKLLRIFTQKLETAYSQNKVGLTDAYGKIYGDEDYFNSLLNEKVNAGEESKLEKILECLDSVYKKDTDTFDECYSAVVNLLHCFEYDEWKTLIENESLHSIKNIYENRRCFSNCMDGLELKDIINKFKSISVEDLSKMLEIIKLRSFREHDNKQEVLELMLSENGMGSLDYIYQVYFDEEQRKYPIPEVPKQIQNNGIRLLTVYELLKADNDTEKVLDGFKDDEEVNSKTLIRTFAYRNDRK